MNDLAGQVEGIASHDLAGFLTQFFPGAEFRSAALDRSVVLYRYNARPVQDEWSFGTWDEWGLTALAMLDPIIATVENTGLNLTENEILDIVVFETCKALHIIQDLEHILGVKAVKPRLVEAVETFMD